MTKTLVVVESPAKAKTIEKYLGDGYAVRASYGHIRDLPRSKLGVDPDQGFAVQYEVPEDSKRHVADLKRALKQNEDLVLATDYDREGEAIAFHVATLLGVEPAGAKRVTFTEITRDAILEAFANAQGPCGELPPRVRARVVGSSSNRSVGGVPDPEHRLAAGPRRRLAAAALHPRRRRGELPPRVRRRVV